jgi:hypothetical protein
VKNIIIILLFVLLSTPGFCQEIKISETIINIAEQLAAEDPDPEAVNIFIEKLHDLSENPIKINASDRNELARLFFLTDFQVKALADYIHSYGRIASVFEIAVIPGFDRETAEMISPFISLDFKQVITPDSAGWKNKIISNFSMKPSLTDSVSVGSPWKILTKYRFVSGSFSGGITTEKDAGEKFLSGNTRMPDFLSASISYTGNGLIKKVIAGDFSARFGQGTNVNTGIRRGISLTSPGYMSASDEIKSFTSSEGSRFFRGAAVEVTSGNFNLDLYISNKRKDATISILPESSDQYVASFYAAGLHNTASLLQKKDAVRESAYGINLSYSFNNLKAGLTWSETRFSLPVGISVNDPEKLFSFAGRKNDLYSVYYNGFLRNIFFYGELTVNSNKNFAVIQGISFRPSDRLTLNFLFRNYTTGYTTFYGNGPGTGSYVKNERGLLGNFEFEAVKHMFISGGFDIQHYPWLKYRCSAPSAGIKKELKVRYLPTDKLTFEVSYYYRMSMIDSSGVSGIPAQDEIITRKVKGSARYLLSDCLTLMSCTEFVTVNPSGSKGVLLSQDINYRPDKSPFSFWFRYCIFTTDSWESRLYLYENDLLYSYSIPALSGKGSRSYLMVKWDISHFAEMRIKYGITTIASTENSVRNNDEFRIQFRLWF